MPECTIDVKIWRQRVILKSKIYPERRLSTIQGCIVTSEQMQAIESRLFEAGIPVAALMEKVAGKITQSLQHQYPIANFRRVAVLIGPGHNGGDALVVARELFESGYEVIRYQPFEKYKELTHAHQRYAEHLRIPVADDFLELEQCDLIIDGLFGFGLTRSLEGAIAHLVNQVNEWDIPVVSIDLPSGLDTDTGQVLGTAIRATHTICLGLWKRSFLQDQALEYIGRPELIDFGIPLTDIYSVLGHPPKHRRITPDFALSSLPLPRPQTTHKYREGHLLLICGSRTYGGAAILAGLSARASGVGMLTIAVPDSLASQLITLIPDALVIACPTTKQGAIAQLPEALSEDIFSQNKYSAIACGPGMTLEAMPVISKILDCSCPLLLDADGLNSLAQMNPLQILQQRSALTVLTPHPGEFRRLFPDIAKDQSDRLIAAKDAAQLSHSTIILKGAQTVIASTNGDVWVNPESTAALARGGSGDVLTGLMGGLMAQAIARGLSLHTIIPSAVWWHAQGAIAAVKHTSELGVNASTLISYLQPALNQWLNDDNNQMTG